ncbi:MAG: type II toxin-antitoxin system RelE/ParE family toxin [Proteobacteria bacterium]|nr:type II toxin-antitoxin system RelE/ParE family toxin [Pseudomonadota bacterium]
MSWKVSLYNGVENDVLKLPDKLQAKILRMFELIETHGTDIGEPHTKAFGHGLFELRAKAKEGIARAFFCYLIDKEIIVLSVFVKKTQKTPKKEIEIAKKRMLEVKNGLTAT